VFHNKNLTKNLKITDIVMNICSWIILAYIISFILRAKRGGNFGTDEASLVSFYGVFTFWVILLFTIFPIYHYCSMFNRFVINGNRKELTPKATLIFMGIVLLINILIIVFSNTNFHLENSLTKEQLELFNSFTSIYIPFVIGPALITPITFLVMFGTTRLNLITKISDAIFYLFVMGYQIYLFDVSIGKQPGTAHLSKIHLLNSELGVCFAFIISLFTILIIIYHFMKIYLVKQPKIEESSN
jgi:hypothetical protein